MMSYSGVLEEVSEGRLTSAVFTKRGFVRIGKQRIRSVTVTDFMDGLLEPGQEMTLSMGFFFFRRWLVAVRRGGEAIREGLFVFLGGVLTHLIGVGLLALLCGLFASGISNGAGAFAGGLVMLYGLATAAINVKLWLVPA